MQGLFANYRPPINGWDEMLDSAGSLRPGWDRLANFLRENSSEEIQSLQNSIVEQLRLNGVTYHVYDDKKGADRSWSLDPVPFILDQKEWQEIERGLKQRAELLDIILRDVYNERELVREELLPPIFLYSHPGFLRDCANISPKHKRMLHFYSADIYRGPDGKFGVMSDRAQNPSGYGYALENRAVLGRNYSTLLAQSGPQKLEGFFHIFMKTLIQAAPPTVKDPFVVLLSPGSENETFFEHAYLASYLRIPLVRGSDLTSRQGEIHLESSLGQRRVDVILRRVDDSFCDPLELNGSSMLGVPGLVQAIRNRKVTVCNALGSGLVGGSALMAFLPAICKHFFGTELHLPSVPTYWCGYKNQREAVLDRFQEMVIKPLYQGPKRSTWFVSQLSLEQREKLLHRIRAKPHFYLAQEKIQLSTAPCFFSNQLEARPLVLRSFLASIDHTYRVMPGGLTRIAARLDSMEVTGQGGGISKDTWIVASENEIVEANANNAFEQTEVIPQTGPLPSYATENLFWLGRYQERLHSQLKSLASLTPYLDWADEYTVGSRAFNKAAIRRTARTIRDLLPEEYRNAIYSMNPDSPKSSSIEDNISILQALEKMENGDLFLGQSRRFIHLGRALEKSLCDIRIIMNTFFENNNFELPNKSESSLSSIKLQLNRFADELTHLPHGLAPLHTDCQKNILTAIEMLQERENAEPTLLLYLEELEGKLAYQKFLLDLEKRLIHISEILASEYFQPVPAPQSLREWN